MESLFAWTAPGSLYPPYFNISQDGDEIVVTLRTTPLFDAVDEVWMCGRTTTLRLPAKDAAELATLKASPALRVGVVGMTEPSSQIELGPWEVGTPPAPTVFSKEVAQLKMALRALSGGPLSSEFVQKACETIDRLSSPPTAALQDGWKMVPRKATQKMLDAGAFYHIRHAGPAELVELALAANTYTAMYDAAPALPEAAP